MASGITIRNWVLVALVLVATTAVAPHQSLHASDITHHCALCQFSHLPALTADTDFGLAVPGETALVTSPPPLLLASPAFRSEQPPRAPPV